MVSYLDIFIKRGRPGKEGQECVTEGWAWAGKEAHSLCPLLIKAPRERTQRREP